MTTKEKPTKGDVIRYWRKRQGGWEHAILVKMGRKWATIKDYWPGSDRRYRVPVGDVQKAVF